MKRTNTLSIRVTETLIKTLDDRAKTLGCSKADLVEKALNCFLGLDSDADCSNQTTALEAVHSLRKELIAKGVL